jgi:hypothetical protein
MPIDGRRKGKLPHPGPYLAEITNHLDSTYMGRLEVALKTAIPSRTNQQSQTYAVKYLSPFYGITSNRFEGNNSGNFNDVQKSYGMWMIPPDVGSTVMVIFVDGDPNEGYWFGCVLNDIFQDHMIPGIAASDKVLMTAEQQKRYGANYLPVAEFNKKTQKLTNPNPESFARPVHPFADRLLAQGLLLDKIRGVTSSGARREVPSMVFGISTPGPLDKNGPKGKIGYKGNTQLPVSRLGGSTFVMDDGDVNGQNELVRIRTRTGHQILLHNSSDLIYIANAAGTAWIELTSAGKIDMYAQDSVSIHTANDFNFRADRDFNLEAGRNINMSAGNNWQADVSNKYVVNAGGAGILSFVSTLDVSAGQIAKVTAGGALHLKGSTLYAGATGDTHISGAELFVTGNGNLNLRGSNILATGGKIHLNGPAAGSATGPAKASTPVGLNLYSLPNRTAGGAWGGGNFYKAGNILSIMQRVPTHEPWDQHESTDPSKYTPELTSSAIDATETAANGAVVPARPSANTPFPGKNGPAVDRGTVFFQTKPWTSDQPFLDKVIEICKKLTFDPLDLIAAMYLETGGTMDPAIKNPLGSATGLIQFIESTAGGLGTTTAKLAQMTRVEQLDYVELYFKKAGWPSKSVPVPSLSNVYLTIFLPKYKTASDDTVIASANDPDPKVRRYYSDNGGFDQSPKKGYFTAKMVSDVAYQRKASAIQTLANNGIGNDLKPIKTA